jgi:DNA-binding NarL/FixJ family response regulator
MSSATTLPVATSMTDTTSATPPIRVMLVDDHRMFAESLARLLGDEPGIEVLGIAGTVREALDMMPKLLPQVVLVDYGLPDGDGITVMTDVKSNYPGTMVVMLTGSNEDRVLLDAINAGCSGFLTKNRAAAEVAEAVRGAAAGEALISPALLGRLLPKLTRTYRSLGSDLTDRERTTLSYLAKGWANKAIASEMNLSLNTVRNYVHSLLTKLGAHSKLEAVSIAVRQGIVDYSSKG